MTCRFLGDSTNFNDTFATSKDLNKAFEVDSIFSRRDNDREPMNQWSSASEPSTLAKMESLLQKTFSRFAPITDAYNRKVKEVIGEIGKDISSLISGGETMSPNSMNLRQKKASNLIQDSPAVDPFDDISISDNEFPFLMTIEDLLSTDLRSAHILVNNSPRIHIACGNWAKQTPTLSRAGKSAAYAGLNWKFPVFAHSHVHISVWSGNALIGNGHVKPHDLLKVVADSDGVLEVSQQPYLMSFQSLLIHSTSYFCLTIMYQLVK